MPISVYTAVPAGPPRSFMGSRLTATSWRLQWKPPFEHVQNGDIVLYEVICSDVRNYLNTDMINTTAVSVIFEGLDPTLSYRCQIRAYNENGPGPWSNILPISPAITGRQTAQLAVQYWHMHVFNASSSMESASSHCLEISCVRKHLDFVNWTTCMNCQWTVCLRIWNIGFVFIVFHYVVVSCENEHIYCNYLVIPHTCQTEISSLTCCIKTDTRPTALCRYSVICNLLANLLMAQFKRLSMTLCYVMCTFSFTFFLLWHAFCHVINKRIW